MHKNSIKEGKHSGKRLIVFVQLLPVIISLLVVGAHFVRSGSIALMFLSIGLTFGLFVREPFVARIVQLALLLASIEWARFAVVFASARVEMGQPWIRLVIISGGVALVSFASIFLFQTKSLKEMYHLDKRKKGKGVAPFAADEKPLTAGMAESSGKEDGQVTISLAAPELLKVHDQKILLNGLSPFAFLLMDFFMVGGVFALIGIGFTNNFLRRKMNSIGGVLSLKEKKTNFLRQMLLMFGTSGVIMLYFYLSMPTPITQKITMSIVAAYALFMSFVTYLEYQHKEQAN